jgi:hypothetical protein
MDVGPPVARQEAASVVAADAEGSSGQVVGAEAEELRRLGDLRGSQGSARQLDQLVDLANAAGDLGCDPVNHRPLPSECRTPSWCR